MKPYIDIAVWASAQVRDAMEKALGECTEFFASKKKNSIFALRNSVTIATISELTIEDYEEN